MEFINQNYADPPPRPKRKYERTGKYSKVSKAARSTAHKDRVCQEFLEQRLRIREKANMMKKQLIELTNRIIPLARERRVPIKFYKKNFLKGVIRLKRNEQYANL